MEGITDPLCRESPQLLVIFLLKGPVMHSFADWFVGLSKLLGDQWYEASQYLYDFTIKLRTYDKYIDGLVQDCSDSIANTLELLQSCTKTVIFIVTYWGLIHWILVISHLMWDGFHHPFILANQHISMFIVVINGFKWII